MISDSYTVLVNNYINVVKMYDTVMAYMEMFGNCSQPNTSDYMRHSVHTYNLLQAEWQQQEMTLTTTQSCSFTHHSTTRFSYSEFACCHKNKFFYRVTNTALKEISLWQCSSVNDRLVIFLYKIEYL